MAAQFKDVPLGDQTYRIGKLEAADGSWIFSTFTKRYRAYMEAQPAAVAQTQPEEGDAPATAASIAPEVGFMLTAAFLTEQLSRQELAEVQNLCLSACGRYSDRTGSPVAMPILMTDGRFAIAELRYDGPTVLELTRQSIAFNIAPFFPGAGSSGQTTSADTSSQPSIQA